MSATPACGPGLDAEAGPPATLQLTVRDGDGAAIPALATLRDQDGTGRSIYSPTQSLSRMAPRLYGMLDSAALLDGAASLPVPPGKWRLTVSRGPEYEIFTQDLVLQAGAAFGPLDVTLERAVDTSGFLSADLHVHAARSQDTTAPLDGRVVAAAVSGLEVLGSADHNSETDYAPVIVAVGLEGRVASLVGNEISLDWAHFSAFPLPFKPEEALGGAPPVETLPDFQNPDLVFAYAHGHPTQPVVQVNHPRYENPPSYFFTYWLDPEACTSPFAFSYDFDVVEVLNGIEVREPYLTTVVGDWLCLVRTGHRVTATGNSDSHGLRGLSPGYPRNYVYTGDDDPSTYAEARFMQALRDHRVVVSTAPFVTIESGDARIGDTVAATAGTLQIRVVVQAASWVPVDKVRVVVGGVVAHELDVPPDGRPRLDQTVEVATPTDTFVVALAYADAFLRRDVVGDIDMPPFAFTNPIFVDADGDGLVTPLRGSPSGTGTPPASGATSVVPPLRAFEIGRRNDDCTYELEPGPGR
ncbi:MAG: CehA/McbA family metallohydrolase [Deltaproteobacteria bacterium]|nr:CehA/McbA family metallohydrolase [Deltaproteobacteria bacterium]